MNAPPRDNTGSTVPSTGEAAEQGQSLFLTTQNDEKPPGWMSFHDTISAGVPARQDNQDDQGELEEVCLGDGKDIFLIDEESDRDLATKPNSEKQHQKQQPQDKPPPSTTANDNTDDPEIQVPPDDESKETGKKKPSPSGKQDPSRPFYQTRKFIVSVVIVVLVIVVGAVGAVMAGGGGGGSSTSTNTNKGGVSLTPAPSPAPVAAAAPSPAPFVGASSPAPTPLPTVAPTAVPTRAPTPTPTSHPIEAPSQHPTPAPTVTPTKSNVPTVFGATKKPTNNPTKIPTSIPTKAPTPIPTSNPTRAPTPSPTRSHSSIPSLRPSPVPTVSHTPTSRAPTRRPSLRPSLAPSSYCDSIPPFQVHYEFSEATGTFPHNGAWIANITHDVTQGHWCKAAIVDISNVTYQGDFGSTIEYFTLNLFRSDGTMVLAAESTTDSHTSDCVVRTESPLSSATPLSLNSGHSMLKASLATTFDVDASVCSATQYVKFSVTVQLASTGLPAPTSAPTMHPSTQQPTTSCDSIAPYQVTYRFSKATNTFPYEGAFVGRVTQDVTQGHWCKATIVAFSTITYQGDFGLSDEYFTLQLDLGDGGAPMLVAQPSGITGGSDCAVRTVAPNPASSLSFDPGHSLLEASLNTTAGVHNLSCADDFVEFDVTVQLEPLPAPATCESLVPVVIDFDFDEGTGTYQHEGGSFNLTGSVGSNAAVLQNCQIVVTDLVNINYQGDLGGSDESFSLRLFTNDVPGGITLASAWGANECRAATIPDYTLGTPIVLPQGQSSLPIQLSTMPAVGATVCVTDDYVRFDVVVRFVSLETPPVSAPAYASPVSSPVYPTTPPALSPIYGSSPVYY